MQSAAQSNALESFAHDGQHGVLTQAVSKKCFCVERLPRLEKFTHFVESLEIRGYRRPMNDGYPVMVSTKLMPRRSDNSPVRMHKVRCVIDGIEAQQIRAKKDYPFGPPVDGGVRLVQQVQKSDDVAQRQGIVLWPRIAVLFGEQGESLGGELYIVLIPFHRFVESVSSRNLLLWLALLV